MEFDLSICFFAFLLVETHCVWTTIEEIDEADDLRQISIALWHYHSLNIMITSDNHSQRVANSELVSCAQRVALGQRFWKVNVYFCTHDPFETVTIYSCSEVNTFLSGEKISFMLSLNRGT